MCFKNYISIDLLVTWVEVFQRDLLIFSKSWDRIEQLYTDCQGSAENQLRVLFSAFSLIPSPQACMAITSHCLSKLKGRVLVFHKSEKAEKMCFQSEEGTDLNAPEKPAVTHEKAQPCSREGVWVVMPIDSKCRGIQGLPAHAIFIRQCGHGVIQHGLCSTPNFLSALPTSDFIHLSPLMAR